MTVMIRPRPFLLTLLGTLLLPLAGQAIDTTKLQAIRPAMESAIEQKQAAGIVTLVMENGKLVHHEAVGLADIRENRRMAKDDVFWIASMTKSINATAIMILVDEGKLSLDAPAAQWFPELGKAKLADGQPPEHPITLRHLLSHTAGIAFPPRKATDGAVSLKSYALSLVKAPLTFAPGNSYEYGFGPTVAGRILEMVSGMPYEDFLAQRIFKPLKMNDTQFNPDDAHRARTARTYKRDEESNQLVPGHNAFVMPDSQTKRMVEPSGGLFSTAADMGRFYAMIANGGELDGTRILSSKAVKDMTTPVTAGGKLQGYAAGWQVNTASQRPSPAMPVGSHGHGGAFGTHGWIDSEHGIVTVFLVQNVLVPEGSKPRDAFHRIVMDAAGVKVEPPQKK
jgi:CubicO group peptidase (beta-lactamase class C family)